MLLTLILTTLPTLLYTTFLWWLDRYEKEPWPLLLAVFVWGAVPAVALALIAEVQNADAILGTPREASIWLAPLVEEPLKALALIGVFLFFRYEFDNMLDGIIYGALIGFGFAMTENALYFYREGSALSSLLWLRVVIFGFNHAFYTSIVGVALGLIRYNQQRWAGWIALPGALFLAIAFHAMHNIASSYAFPGVLIAWLISSGGVLIVVLIAIITWRKEQSWIDHELLEEVQVGFIDPGIYNTVRSSRRRVQSQWGALLHGGWRSLHTMRALHHHLTELAFLKYQLRIGDCHCRPSDLQPLRQRILEGMVDDQH
ncbi:MAG: PrsW family intramembrane metalloprotease [Herpetosiphonaceae bacterium]|nr:PrsW family intramembrane metalloprotease [Herpetosiphonaceae bacterium]